MSSVFKMKQPAGVLSETWREGTPLGNGLHGALMYGKIYKEKIMLMHTKLWRDGRHPDIPDVSDVLPVMRQNILDGRIPDADRMLVDALREKGYNPHYAHMTPALDVNIVMPEKSLFKHYSRELDMETGEGRVLFESEDGRSVCRRSFVSRADDVFVVECGNDCTVNLSIHMPDSDKANCNYLPVNAVCEHDGQWIYFKCEAGGREHGAVARVTHGETTLAVVRIYFEGQSDTEWQNMKTYISALPESYDELFSRHAPIHKELFGRCRFELSDSEQNYNMTNEQLLDIAFDDELPNALTQRMWDYGRYLFICGTDKNGYPCNLTGLWCGDYHTTWSFNMANINLEMIYWHVLLGNLTELMLPVFDYYDSGIKDFKENAKQIYGCRGIFLPAVTMPGAMKNVCMAPHIVNWTGGAGWISQLYFDYYLYTKDKDFLINRAIPFMRESADFYLDFIIRDEHSWHVCPSVSPENRTECYRGNKVKWSLGTQSSVDATMDVAIIKDLLANLLMIHENTGYLAEKEVERYRWVLDNAPEYKVNKHNAPREWLCDDFEDNDKHRHQSHLFPMFPGFEKVRADEKTDALYRQGGIMRMTAGVSYQTSWSLVQNANMMARVRDGELAYRSLNIISKTCIMSNLFTTHNDWRDSGITYDMQSAVFQIDANIGWVSAVIEMLLFSYVNRVDILPALPQKWSFGKIGWLRTRCAVEVNIEWGNNIVNVEIRAFSDTEFDLYMPDGSCEHIVMRIGESIERKSSIKKYCQ